MLHLKYSILKLLMEFKQINIILKFLTNANINYLKSNFDRGHPVVLIPTLSKLSEPVTLPTSVFTRT